MVAPKPIPFEQVRVRTDFDDAQSVPRAVVRAPLAGRQLLAFQWSRLIQPEPDEEREPEHADDPDRADDQHAVSARHGLRPLKAAPGAQLRDTGEPRQSASFEREPELAHSDSPSTPPHQTGIAAVTRSSGVPISAIAKSVRQAAVLGGLTDTIKELCNGEENQRLGPWDMTLPLDAHGLGTSILDLRLSVGELLLRFRCSDSAVLDLLSSGVDKLSAQLHESLYPPLDVRIELGLS